MKKSRVMFFSALFMMLALSALPSIAEAAGPAPEASAAAAVNRAAFGLYRLLSPGRVNFCFSPYSVTTVFAMTYAGAKGETAEELGRAFAFDENIHASYSKLLHLIASPPAGAGELVSANSVWPQSGYRLLGSYRKILQDYYASLPTPLDFEKNPERARTTINEWVLEKTRERIADLLPAGTVDSETRMVLVNAIYLKAPWLEPFGESATEMKLFRARDGEIFVPTMQKREFLSYAENDSFRAVRIPYRQRMFSMTILLPKEEDGLDASIALESLERFLSPELVAAIDGGIQKRLVDLSLPKFKIESDFELKTALRTLGVKAAFEPSEADFSRINGKRNLFIGSAVHKAFIDVDENGTEAAAATAAAMTRTSMPLESTPLVFSVDRPFVFFIRDEVAGAILFLGRVDDPTKR